MFEIYNSEAQTCARMPPALLQTQCALVQLWHTSKPQTTKLSLCTPISYHDRFWICLPRDRAFALGPHIDGGSLEH